MNKLIISALLIAGLSTSAFATGVSGDLVLGFRATSGTGSDINLTIDLGNFEAFKQGTASPLVMNLSSGLGANSLDSIYGANWNTRSDVFWGVAGAIATGSTGPQGEPQKTTYIGAIANGSLLDGTAASTAYNRGSAISQGTPTAKILGVYSSLTGPVTQVPFDSGVSFTTLVGNSPLAFNAYQKSSFDNNLNIGGTYVASDLYEMTPGTGPGTYLGTFAIHSNGDLTFTSLASAVPEPSTYALIVGAVAFGFVALRRRKQVQA